MPDPSWASSPPEANYLRLAGAGTAGAASTLASVAAWQAVAAGNELAASVSTVNTAATAADFQGVGGLGSATRATGLNHALQLLSGWAQQKVPIAATAVEAYQSAVAAMIPAEVSLANRAEQAANVALNPLVLGALTPAIVALDTIYFGEHWPHNASAGIAYGTTLAGLAAALAVPPPLTPPGAAAAAPVTAAAAVAQTAGQAAAGEAMSQSAQLAATPGAISAAPVQATAQAANTAAQAAQPLGSALGASQLPAGMFAGPGQAFEALSGLASTGFGQAGEPVGGWAAGIPGLGAALNPGLGGSVPTPEPGGSGARAAGVGAGISGAPGAGLTSYARPASAFGPENSGRPATLKAGLLGAAELSGPTTLGPGVMPAGHAPAGMLGRGKPEDGKAAAPSTRVAVTGDRPLVRRNS